MPLSLVEALTRVINILEVIMHLPKESVNLKPLRESIAAYGYLDLSHLILDCCTRDICF